MARHRRLRRRTPWDRVTAIASIMIASLALAASIHQARLEQVHRELMVSPRIVNVFDLEVNAERPGLRLENRGVGPAVFRDLRALNFLQLRGDSGQPVGRLNTRESTRAVIDAMRLSRAIRFEFVGSDFSVLPGQVVRLFETSRAEFSDDDWRAEFSGWMGELDLAYCYCSAYDRCWEGGSRIETASVEDCSAVSYLDPTASETPSP